jgi:hypothetical protein
MVRTTLQARKEGNSASIGSDVEEPVKPQSKSDATTGGCSPDKDDDPECPHGCVRPYRTLRKEFIGCGNDVKFRDLH